MPFELGMVIGAKLVRGGKPFSNRPLLVLESEKYAYQKCLSDIAGQDIKAHGNEANKVIAIVRNWLRSFDDSMRLPGEKMLQGYFAEFDEKLPEMCHLSHNDEQDLSYPDLLGFMQAFLEQKAA